MAKVLAWREGVESSQTGGGKRRKQSCRGVGSRNQWVDGDIRWEATQTGMIKANGVDVALTGGKVT